MSETQSKPAENEDSKQSRFQNPLLWGTMMAILALLAPVSLTISFREYETIYTFSALIWHGTRFSTGIFRMENFFGAFLPILCLRLASALQTANYYRGNTTRKRTALIILIGEGPYLLSNIVALFSFLQLPGLLIIPLPIQMIVGLLILWRLPLPEPTKPWKEKEESGSWWTKSKKKVLDESKPN
ncbi:MAG: hypothetical protein E4H14_00385 [Candidatus Thorarchaeota archaeon]|nr:MAG: hypothetical protein E4H14_00385 [Candidatus Thorarchaeota archaeon]